MERSYGFPSNFASKQIFFIMHIGEIYYKGLDLPSSILLITRGFSSHALLHRLIRYYMLQSTLMLQKCYKKPANIRFF